jgi:hypothetical protein
VMGLRAFRVARGSWRIILGASAHSHRALIR